VFDLFPELNNFAKKDMKGKIHLLKSTSYGFETEAFDLAKPTIDLDLNYGTGFSDMHNNIVDTIQGKNDNNAKLVLLHGLAGTGKTTYLKYLAHELGKKVLFLPPVMAESIVNPDFVPFLMENKDCVLIIEDAEKVIGDRQNSGSSVGVSNLLNLSDGILGDILNIHVIATFNMDKEKIDSALLRKGRLIAEHKFGKLSLEDTQTLLKKLNKQTEAKEGMTLAEIYNIDNQQDKSKDERATIGFTRY
jgi:SpoVK/Ycf46/Vps4 family AAA+-type ATPase